jgi:Tfp pilus assembly protein PilN
MSIATNLMSPTATRAAAARAGLRWWAAIFTLAGILLSIAYSHASQAANRAATRRASLESRYQPIVEARTETRETRQRIETLKQNEALALNVATPRPTLALVGAISTAAAPLAERVYIRHFHYVSAGRDADQSALLVTGVGEDDAAVSQFVANLADVPVFANVEMKSSNAKRNGEQVVREFVLQCMVK